jgi:hypothetical protein
VIMDFFVRFKVLSVVTVKIPCTLIDRYSFPLKMEAAGSSGTFVTIYQTPRHHTPEDSNINDNCLLDDIVPVFVCEKRLRKSVGQIEAD